jgi:hypothetical protein
MGEDNNQEYAYYQNQGVTIRDLEERQRILKDRLLLIGQNLIEIKEKNEENILEVKKELEELKESVERMKSFIETLSGEFSNLARKEDLEILTKQAKMFQPMNFVRKEDLEKLKKN